MDTEKLREMVITAINRCSEGSGKSQAVLAKRIGVSPGTISKWKNGRNLSRSQLALVALMAEQSEKQAA